MNVGEPRAPRLEWPGKQAALQAAATDATCRLRARRDESVDHATTAHLFIEGDNLEALKLLRKTHTEGVDVIFIDPPYNSGKAWMYCDSGLDTTAWLNMMAPRLQLARQLLAPDGLMAVAIDDRELLHLGKLLDEIFGAGHRLACAPWRSEASGGRQKTGLRCGHEYILLYAKQDRGRITRDASRHHPLNRQDTRGAYRKGRELMKWGGTSLRTDRPNQFYPLPTPDGATVLPYRHDGLAGHWRWGKDNPRIVQAMRHPDEFHWELRPFDAGVQVDGRTQRWVPYEKLRDTHRSVAKGTWLDHVGTNADATRELKALFGAKIFDTPKPTSLIKWVLALHGRSDAVVLDFFAGSASTGHAVMALNREDGGRRRFILVQHAEACPEQSAAGLAGFAHIAALARERLRRAGAQLRAEDATLDVGYRLLEVVGP